MAIIPAFSMSEMYDKRAEFGRGKDKKKRMSRGMALGLGAAGVGTLGAAGYAGTLGLRKKGLDPKVRSIYRTTALPTPVGSNMNSTPTALEQKLGKSSGENPRLFLKEKRDLNYGEATGRRFKRDMQAVRNAPGRLAEAWKTGGLGRRAGIVGAGLGGAALLGGAGYGAYRYANSDKKRKAE